MSTPSQNPAGDAPAARLDDPTRDIRLPSLPDRPRSIVRPEWQAHVRPAVADPSPAQAPAPGEQPAPGSEAAPESTAVVPPSAPPRPYVLPNEPTDELSSPPRVRQPTLTFDADAAGAPAPSAGHAPPSSRAVPRVVARKPERRWPWVVLTLLPILVIVAAGLLLFVLLGGGW